MELISPPIRKQSISRRVFLKAGLLGAAGLGLYSSELERHWIDITQIEIRLKSLPAEFDGLRMAQLSDIHLGEYTEEFFLEHAVKRINALKPDVVLLTGDFITSGVLGKMYGLRRARPCAEILRGLACTQRYAVLGNHDMLVHPDQVAAALRDNGVKMLRNEYDALERGGARIWMAGVDDPLEGNPDPAAAIPAAIRGKENEPVVLLCHAPDYIARMKRRFPELTVDLMVSGHTHGGQVRIPFMRAMSLPPLGRTYVEGLFTVGGTQLYVNRGLGTVGLPIRFNCPPEITIFTLRRG